MAEKRMFTQKIIDSDSFLDMPLSSQALYFHLNMRADDDGFINNPKRICRTIGASEDDLKLLLLKRFVIGFESGVLVIKHWRMHNTLRKDRYNPTQYQDEFARLDVKDNNAYTERPVESLATTWQPSGNQLAPQYSIEKNSIDKNSIVEVIVSEPDGTEKPPKPVKHKYGEYNNVLLTDDELDKLKEEFPDWQERIERLSSYVASTGKSYKSHYATIRNWARKDGQTAPQKQGGRKEMVPAWMNKDREESFDSRLKKDMDWLKKFSEEQKTVENDPDLKARADALRQSFQ